jgi:GGDEF domain-containing protein
VDVDGRALARLSDVCRQSARVSDAVGRLGRVEVVIIAPATDAAGAERIVSRVRALVEAVPLGLGDAIVPIRVIAGVATVDDFSTSSSDVVSLVLRAAEELRTGRGAMPAAAALAIG